MIQYVFSDLVLFFWIINYANYININRENEKMNYKLKEITEYFVDSLQEYDKDFIDENWDDLHHEIFNTDYYIIGRYLATKWLGEEVFNVIQHIKEYEQDNFGEVNTDLSEPEHVVNMYVYIIGERVVESFKSIYGFYGKDQLDPDFNFVVDTDKLAEQSEERYL